MAERPPESPGSRPPDESWSGQLDEVGLDLGPDSVRGLLDPYERSGDSNSTGDRTAPRQDLEGAPAHPEARRAALLARLLTLPAPDPARTLDAHARESLRRRLAEEAPDPLPLPLGALPPGLGAPDVGATTRPWSAAEVAEAVRAPAVSSPEPEPPRRLFSGLLAPARLGLGLLGLGLLGLGLLGLGLLVLLALLG